MVVGSSYHGPDLIEPHWKSFSENRMLVAKMAYWSGIHVVGKANGKCSWKDWEVGKFWVGKFLPSSSYLADR